MRHVRSSRGRESRPPPPPGRPCEQHGTLRQRGWRNRSERASFESRPRIAPCVHASRRAPRNGTRLVPEHRACIEECQLARGESNRRADAPSTLGSPWFRQESNALEESRDLQLRRKSGAANSLELADHGRGAAAPAGQVSRMATIATADVGRFAIGGRMSTANA
jgi:hypothetical protein